MIPKPNMGKPGDLLLKELSVASILADTVLRETKADIAFIPAATYSGNVSADSLTAIPLQDDPIVIIELTGVQILNAVTRSISYAPKAFAGLLSTAGMTSNIVIGIDSRVKLMSVDVMGKRLDMAKRYRVAMPKPLADGQLGYFQVWDKQTTRTATTLTVLGCNRKAIVGNPAVPSYKTSAQ